MGKALFTDTKMEQAITRDDIRALKAKVMIDDELFMLLMADIGGKIRSEGLRRGNNYISLTIVIR